MTDLHVPDVQSVPILDPPVFYPGCECGWFGKGSDDVVHAARAAKDHARMSKPTCGDHKYAVEPPRPGRPPDPPSPVCSKEPGHTDSHRGRGSGGRGYVEWPNESAIDQPLEASDE